MGARRHAVLDTLHVGDLDDVLHTLSSHAVVPVSGVLETGYGPRYMLVGDPDGNLVEFVEGVASPRSPPQGWG